MPSRVTRLYKTMIVCYLMQSSVKNIYRDLLFNIIIKWFFYLGNTLE